MRTILISALLAAATPTLAQQPQPVAQQGTPAEEALRGKLIAEINAGLGCSTALVGLQRQLEAAQTRIHELEAAAAKKDEPPKP